MRRTLTVEPRRQTARWMRERIADRFIAEIESAMPAYRRQRFRSQCRRVGRGFRPGKDGPVRPWLRSALMSVALGDSPLRLPAVEAAFARAVAATADPLRKGATGA